uniref:uncharacterized protein LOC105350945 n=1 Tax=Fragaria vesca subsp. vesca TaxID=101020 RepID=UPI0005C9930A|nr:PREDICTED: uncharacterized protein LOC105350945 [Fragaria vesca subsp. vesca]
MLTHDVGHIIRDEISMVAPTWGDTTDDEQKKLPTKLFRRSTANKSNRDKKTLHHHTEARPFIYNAKELKDKGEHLYFIKSYSQAYDLAHSLKAAENEVSGLHPAFALLPGLWKPPML